MAQSTIDFLLNNNVTIIQVVFGVIFLLVVFVILRSFKEDKAPSAPQPAVSSKQRREEYKAEQKAEAEKPVMPKEDSPLDDLDNLDDLLAADEANAAQVDKTLSDVPQMSPVMSAAPAAAPAAPNAELTQALSEKEKVIADLKAEILKLQQAPPPAGAAASPELEGKVKELTEKLAEYEIIEDDIANLSFYKNENTKLKNELDRLKGISVAASEAAVKEVTATPPPAPEIKEPSAPVATKPEPIIEPPPEPKLEVNPKESTVLDEFEEAVKQKEVLEKNVVAASESSAPIAVGSDADLLKEFENMVEQELGTPKKAATEAAPTPAPAQAAAPAADINSNKLVEEMEALAKAAPPETKDDGKDSNQKLIEEFENFVNKSN